MIVIINLKKFKKMINLSNNFIVRSSSAEFLIFERQKGEKGIEVRFEDGDLWLTQKAISDLFDISKQDVSYHLKNIFNTLELEEKSVVKYFFTIVSDNKNIILIIIISMQLFLSNLE